MLDLSNLCQSDKSMTSFALSLKIQVYDDHIVCKVVINLSKTCHVYFLLLHIEGTAQQFNSKYKKRFYSITIYTNIKGIIKTKNMGNIYISSVVLVISHFGVISMEFLRNNRIVPRETPFLW